MSKLVCDFGSFNTEKSNIANKVNEYDSLLNALVSLENTGLDMWNCEAQRAFYSTFMERKNELEQLSRDYSEVVSTLNEIISTYDNIESSY